MRRARPFDGGSEGRVSPALLVLVLALAGAGLVVLWIGLERGPKPRWRRYDEAVSAFESGSFGLSAELFTRYLDDFGEYPPALYMLGLADWKQGRVDRAVENVRRAAELDPDLDEASVFLAKHEYDRGEFSEALRWSRTALASEPLPPEADYVAGMCLSRGPLLDIGGAIEHLERARAGGVATAESLLLLIEYQAKIRGIPGHLRSEEYWTGLVEQAHGALETVHGEATGSAPALVRWARFHLLVEDPERALEFLNRRRGAGPENAEMWMLLARAYSGLGDPVSRRAAVRHLLGQDDIAGQMEGLGRFLEAEGDTVLLGEVFRALDEKPPVSPGYAAFRIDRHLDRGETGPAVALAERSLRTWPEDPRLVVRLARALMLAGDRAGAIRQLEAAAEAPALRGIARSVLAEILLDSRTYTLSDLERARQIVGEVDDEGARLYLTGLLSLRSGDLPAAVASLAACLRRDPFERAARERLVEALIRQDDLRAAIRELGILIELEGETRDRLLLRAELNLLQGPEHLRSARNDARRALEIHPDRRPARRLLARIALSSRPRMPREALRTLGDPDVGEEGDGAADWLLRGEAFLVLERPGDARRCSERALALAQGVAERIDALRLARRSGDGSDGSRLELELAAGLDRPEDRAEVQRRLGWLRFEAGDHDGARVRAERAIEEEGATAANLRLRFEASLASGSDREEAGRIVGEMEAVAPLDPDSLYCRGRLHGLAGDYDRAIPILERAVALSPGDVYALTELGRARLRTGDAEQAAALLERAKRVRPDLLDARILLAESRTEMGAGLEREGRWTEAVRVYGGAGGDEWLYAPAVLGLARATVNLRGPGARLSASHAVEKCDRLIALLGGDPESLDPERRALLARAWLAKADLHESLGQWNAVAEATVSYLALEPGQEWATIYLGAAWLLAGEPGRAAMALEEMAVRNPGEWRVAALLSEALMRTGRHAAAAEMLQRWTSDPERGVDATLLRAQALRLAGRTGEALELLGRLFTATPSAVAGARQALDLAQSEEELTRLESQLLGARTRAEARGDYSFLAGMVSARTGVGDALSLWRRALAEGFASEDLEMECLARTLKAMVDRGEALRALEYARRVAERARSDEPWMGRSWVLAEACCMAGVATHAGGDVAGAKRLFSRSLEILPDHALAANNLAYLLLVTPPGESPALRAARLDEALSLARVALAGRPEEPDFADTMAAVQIAAGHPLDALETLDAAISAWEARRSAAEEGESVEGRRMAPLLVRRAEASLEANLRPEARAALDRARSLDPRLVSDPSVMAIEAQLSGE